MTTRQLKDRVLILCPNIHIARGFHGAIILYTNHQLPKRLDVETVKDGWQLVYDSICELLIDF